MRCRVAGLLGMPPSDVDQLPTQDVDLLARYWHEEPWGPWRDNLHAAIIAREVRRGLVRNRTPVPLDPFMVKAEEIRQAENRGGLIAILRAMAGTPVTAASLRQSATG